MPRHSLCDQPAAAKRVLERIAQLELAIQLQVEDLDRKLDGQSREIERMAASLGSSLFQLRLPLDFVPWIALSAVASCLGTCAFAAAFL